MRLKDFIKPVNLGLQFINKLNPVSYMKMSKSQYKGEEDNDYRYEFGLLAQEVDEILKDSNPESTIVTKDQEGFADFSSIKLTKILGYNADKAKLFWERLVKEKPTNNIIAKFRDVDSNKIRIINYTLEEEITRVHNKNDYDKFKMKHNL